MDFCLFLFLRSLGGGREFDLDLGAHIARFGDVDVQGLAGGVVGGAMDREITGVQNLKKK